MGLPLYLAMNAAEIANSTTLPPMAWMACHFSPCSDGLTNLPLWLPEGALVILDDLIPCGSHRPDLVADQLRGIITAFGCNGVILDFQRPESSKNSAMAAFLLQALPWPVAVSDLYAPSSRCPVFLRPGPLWEPLEAHLIPWNGREIWLEVALCQQNVTVTPNGTDFSRCIPCERLSGGFYDERLCCNYITALEDGRIQFTLFDTEETLVKKLDRAHSLGISRAVGLYQELGSFLSGK